MTVRAKESFLMLRLAAQAEVFTLPAEVPEPNAVFPSATHGVQLSATSQLQHSGQNPLMTVISIDPRAVHSTCARFSRKKKKKEHKGCLTKALFDSICQRS